MVALRTAVIPASSVAVVESARGCGAPTGVLGGRYSVLGDPLKAPQKTYRSGDRTHRIGDRFWYLHALYDPESTRRTQSGEVQ